MDKKEVLSSFLATETGSVLKKWKDRLPVALLYPNTYPVAVSNLGFQLVYSLLNDLEFVVCERFVYPSRNEALRSLESNRPMADFPLLLASISFENDYPRLIAMLTAGNLEPMAAHRSPRIKAGDPLVIFGGVATFMNPEPLASFADLMVLGEAEPLLQDLVEKIYLLLALHASRAEIIGQSASIPGCYAPSLYHFHFGRDGRVEHIEHERDVPPRVKRIVQSDIRISSHSQLFSPEAELGMFMTELGRGCSRGCRFCAAGFIYRPPRLWNAEAILLSLEERPATMPRIGLLGMEMASDEVLDEIAATLEKQSCSLSFSSLRADRISGKILSLLAGSRLKSAAIAPDGSSERLRRVINKGLGESDLISAATALVKAGIMHLKLYVMIGLPGETLDDLDELLLLIRRIKGEILPLGKKRGRVATMTLSVNSFVPKPWTPFQYVPFGGLDRSVALEPESIDQALSGLKKKIRYLRHALTDEANVRINTDRPEAVLQQAVFARGDRRLAPVLFDMATADLSLKKALKKHDLTAWEYAVRPRDAEELFCWDIVDHGISKSYLWHEYQKALAGKMTDACNTAGCRRCGVCDEDKHT